MTEALELWRRDVLEHPEKYDALERAAAWAITARHIRSRGIDYEWAADLAEHEARKALADVLTPVAQ